MSMPNFKLSKLAYLFPSMSEVERAELSSSLAAFGPRDPITTWQEPSQDGTTFELVVIDGRNRLEEIGKLDSIGHMVKVDGVDTPIASLIKFSEFVGTKVDALNYVLDKNMKGRRMLTSGQKAAIQFKADLLNKRMKGPADKDGNTVASIATAAQTNRQYYFDAKKIYEVSAKILDKVIEGVLSIQQAKRVIKDAAWVEAVKADKPYTPPETPATPDGGQGTPAEGEEGATAVPDVFDGTKKAVPGEFHGLFNAREVFKSIVKQVDVLKSNIEGLGAHESGAGANLKVKELLANLDVVKEEVKAACPHVVCPYCNGDGKHLRDKKKACVACKRSKFLTAAQYKLVPKEVKKAREDDTFAQIVDSIPADYTPGHKMAPTEAPATEASKAETPKEESKETEESKEPAVTA